MLEMLSEVCNHIRFDIELYKCVIFIMKNFLSEKCQHFLAFQDSYHNLTLKTVMGLKWMSIFCPHAKFILKTDDDIYVNVPLLTSTAALESNFYNNIHGM